MGGGLRDKAANPPCHSFVKPLLGSHLLSLGLCCQL